RNNAALLERIAVTLNVVDRAAFFLNKWSEEEEDLAEDLRILDLAQKSMRGVAPGARLELMRRRNALIDRIVGVRDALARTVVAGDGRPGDEVRPTPLWRRLLVSPRQATLVFLVLPNAVAIFTIVLGRITLLVHSKSRTLVRERVASYHRHLCTEDVIARDI